MQQCAMAKFKTRPMLLVGNDIVVTRDVMSDA
jgi:hypothetical protein